MDFEFTCVYNPDYGTEEDVDPQLVFTAPAGTDYIKLMGVAQGIAELSYSFGSRPVKWFKIGRKSQAKIIFVVPLLTGDGETWRSGFWLASQLPLSADTVPPEVAYRLVGLAFKQHLMKHGKPPVMGAPKDESTQYWATFVSNGFASSVASLVAQRAIWLAPGSLNPIARGQLRNIRDEHHACDLIVTTVEDGSAVYEGEKLGLETRVTLQRWLTSAVPTRAGPALNAKMLQPRSETPESADVSRNDETVPADISIDSRAGEASEEVPAEATEAPAHEPQKQEQTKSNWLSPSSYLANMAGSLHSWAVPSLTMSMPAMPAMPSITSLPSVSLPSLTSSTVSEWWKSADEVAPITEGLLISAVELFDIETNEKLYVSVWRHALYDYTAVYKDRDICIASTVANTRMFEQLSAQLEGFSFAFEPPTRFYYMIIDPARSAVTSTFPASLSANSEVLRSLIDPPDRSQQIVRLGSTWLYFLTMANGGYAIFGKKNISTQQPTLLGALHSDVQSWLDEYSRKYFVTKGI